MGDAQRAGRDFGLQAAVLAGDARAWQILYDEAFVALDRFVSWRCAGLRSLADDILQETWLTAVRSLRRFDPHAGSFDAWLRGIASNVIRNHLRSRRRSKQVPLTEDRAARDDGRAIERAEQIARTLDALPDHYEAILRAKYLDGSSVAEIAATRGESEKAIESLLTRARAAFRQEFDHRE